MRAAIHNPYWDTLGGGERYTASFVSLLLKNNYYVDIQWPDMKLLKQINTRFDIDVSKASIVESINRGDGYDLCFWLSDGSIPTLKSRKNILHFQFPFQDTQQNILFNKMKFFRIKHIICNSEFTKKFIDQEFKINSEVIYPPIDTARFKPKRKQNIIIYIGRFSQLTQSKNQHILITEFKNLYDSGFKDWKLVLAGGGEVGAQEYIDKLKTQAKSYPISIQTSLSFKKIQELYGKAKIFWSAVGLNVDEESNPLKVEHFGMTLVEAMSAGCVPIVPERGGYREIVFDGDNGFFWKEKGGLAKITKSVIDSKTKTKDISKSAMLTSKKFDNKQFEEMFSKII